MENQTNNTKHFLCPVTFTEAECALVFLALNGQLPVANGQVHIPTSRVADFASLSAKLEEACVPDTPSFDGFDNLVDAEVVSGV